MNEDSFAHILARAAIAATDDFSDADSLDEEVPVNFASMTDLERETHLKSFETNQVKFREEYEKVYGCRIVQVPRRKEDTGFFSFMGHSTQTLIGTDGNNFISDIRDIEDENTDRDEPANIHLYIDTTGGNLATAEVICKALLQYPGRVTVFVSNQAMSAGTLIALCGHKIMLRSHAHLGQIDPQIGSSWFWLPANSIEAASTQINDYETPWVRDLLRGGIGPAQNANARVADLLNRIAEMREWSSSFRVSIASNLLSNLTTGGFGHDRPYDYYDLTQFWSEEGTEMSESNPKLHADWPRSSKILMREKPAPVEKKASYLSAFGI